MSETTGLVVLHRGLPVWIGSERTLSPHLVVYDDYAKARRAARRIAFATRGSCGEPLTGYSVGSVRVTVDRTSKELTFRETNRE